MDYVYETFMNYPNSLLNPRLCTHLQTQKKLFKNNFSLINFEYFSGGMQIFWEEAKNRIPQKDKNKKKVTHK